MFLGISCGGIFSANIVGKVSWKTILLISLLGNGIGLFLYGCFSEYYTLGFGRWLSGFNQVFLLVFIPIYIDAFADKKSKPLWMSAAMIASPIGTLLGFGLTAFTISEYNSWRISF